MSDEASEVKASSGRSGLEDPTRLDKITNLHNELQAGRCREAIPPA